MLSVLRFFSHEDIANVADYTGAPVREVARVAEALAEFIADANENVAATGTNEGQAYKRVAAVISTSGRELARMAAAAQLQLTPKDAITVVKGMMPAAAAVADDANLDFYWKAAQSEAGLSPGAPIGALQGVMNTAAGESKRDARARPCLATASPPGAPLGLARAARAPRRAHAKPPTPRGPARTPPHHRQAAGGVARLRRRERHHLREPQGLRGSRRGRRQVRRAPGDG